MTEGVKHSYVDTETWHLVSDRKQGWETLEEGSSPFPSVPDASCRCRMDLEQDKECGK